MAIIYPGNTGNAGPTGPAGPAGPAGDSSYSNSQIIDFGPLPLFERKLFTIFDANIHLNSIISGTIAVDPATKDADENEMDATHFVVSKIYEGAFDLVVIAQEGAVHDKFEVTYFVG